jgi:hypothetical protein
VPIHIPVAQDIVSCGLQAGGVERSVSPHMLRHFTQQYPQGIGEIAHAQDKTYLKSIT